MITKEAIEADALAQEIRRVDGSNSLGAGALAEALVPFLSTLPIAVDPLPEELPGPLQWEMADAFEASEADTTAGKMIAVYDVVRSALVSSPGKDGGQEVEAAEWQGRYWIEDENRWSNWITNPTGYPWAYDPQEGKSEVRYLYPHPASTALVERLTKAAGAIANNQLLTGDALAELSAAYRALSASLSTSSEGAE